MAIVLTGTQATWRDSYASSPEVGLTVRANGEEDVSVFNGTGFVPAGIEAPTVAPTCAAGSAGGSLTNGKFIGYRYVYAATTKYPLVENVVAGGGNVSPRSNPSPVSAVFTVTANGRCVVTFTGTGRSDITKVWIYRTVECDTSAEATTRVAAGDCYFLASENNPGGATTATYTDSGTVVLVEQLEIDNEMAPIFQYTVYDGLQWWGFGNNPYSGPVTLDNSSTITLTSGTWFDGRDGQKITFAGITTGGADGFGTFYFKRLTSTTASLYSEPALTTLLVVSYSGTTTATIKGYSSTLYKSKIRNPFSWGFTELLTSNVRVPQTWAYKIGGGFGTALAVVPNDFLIKIDMEEPSKCCTLNINNAQTPTSIGETIQSLDQRYSIGSHFSQFAATTKTGESSLVGIDAKNMTIIQSSSQSQGPITSGELMTTMRSLQQTGRDAHFYHGVYDSYTELNCWWVKTLSDVDASGAARTHYCDTLIWNHAPSGLWGRMFDFDVSASCAVFDTNSKKFVTLIGTESGQIAKAFDSTIYTNFISSDSTTAMAPTSSPRFSYVTQCTSGASLDGTTLIYRYGLSGATLGIWFNVNSSATTIPATVSACTQSFRVDVLSTDTAAQVVTKIITAFAGYPTFIAVNLGGGSFGHTDTSTYSGTLPALSAFTAPFEVTGYNALITLTYTGAQLFPTTTANDARGVWCLMVASTGRPAGWVRYAWSRSNAALSFLVPDRAVTYDGTSMNHGAEIIPTASQIAFGGILCSARTYFDLDTPSTVKRNLELWLCAQNIGSTTATGSAFNNQGLGFGQYVSFYKEFDRTTPQSTFALNRDFLPGSVTADSVNWLTKTKVPSTKQNQFGMEILEMGQGQWRPMAITIKNEHG